MYWDKKKILPFDIGRRVYGRVLRAEINADRLEIPGISCVKQAINLSVANLHDAEVECTVLQLECLEEISMMVGSRTVSQAHAYLSRVLSTKPSTSGRYIEASKKCRMLKRERRYLSGHRLPNMLSLHVPGKLLLFAHASLSWLGLPTKDLF